jgi:Spy/CpxP family protein refolding chaperone
MKRNLILSIVACGASLAICPVMQAQDASPAPAVTGTDAGAGGHHWGHGEGQLAMLTKALNLTPDQQEKIKPIVDSFHTTMQGVRQDTTLARPDKMAKIKAAHETEVSQINAILTPDQQTAYAALQAKMHNHRHEGGEGAGAGAASPAATP